MKKSGYFIRSLIIISFLSMFNGSFVFDSQAAVRRTTAHRGGTTRSKTVHRSGTTRSKTVHRSGTTRSKTVHRGGTARSTTVHRGGTTRSRTVVHRGGSGTVHSSHHTVVRHRPVTRTVVIGSRVRVLPSSCLIISYYGANYYRCGSYYYQPYYEGSEVIYVVVEKPN